MINLQTVPPSEHPSVVTEPTSVEPNLRTTRTASTARRVTAASQLLMGTTRHATARFQMYTPAPGIQTLSGTLQTLKERLIQWSPLGSFVSPERYRNSPVRLELTADHSPDLVLQYYDTYTDQDGNVTRLLTEPGLDLSPGHYWLNILIPEIIGPKLQRKTAWHFIRRLPLRLLPDDPRHEEQHRAIICDIDGTVYYTAYQTFLEMLSTAYTKPAGKVFIEGMPLLLRTLQDEPNTTLHGVSCSPEKLRDFIQETTQRERFQFDTLRLNKDFSATRSRERLIYKITRCLELLEELPRHSTLLLIGDNKEQDTQTYELLKDLLELPRDGLHAHVTAWASQVINMANQIRPDTVNLTHTPFVRTRLESLAFTVLAREHRTPDVFIVESHRPSSEYLTQVRQLASRTDTCFCENGHEILATLMKRHHRDIRRLDFLLRNTREPNILEYLEN
ncbi:MAG: hypothetical protein P8104_02045 [Gammaproteobacteria bacterium]